MSDATLLHVSPAICPNPDGAVPAQEEDAKCPVTLSGTTEVGKNVILAGQVGVAGHCKIGDGVIVTAQSGTHGDIPPGAMVSGSPAFDHRQWRRSVAVFAKLPELARAIRGAGTPKEK